MFVRMILSSLYIPKLRTRRCAAYAETVLKCEETLNRIRDVEQSLPEDRRRRVLEIRKKVDDMKDEDALPILESLLKEARNG